MTQRRAPALWPPDAMDTRDTYLSAFAEFEQTAGGQGPAWLQGLRRQAIACFADVGFPSTRLEDWRYTNVAPITKTPFVPVLAPHGNGLTLDWLEQATASAQASTRLVLVDGHISTELSSLHQLPAGVEVAGLAAAVGGTAATLEAHLSRYARTDQNGFVALNTAFLQDGAFVRVSRGTRVETPTHLVFVSTTHGRPTVSHPRTLIVVEEDAQATIVESYVGVGDGVYFTNAVTELVAGQNAVVEACKLAQEAPSAFHVATLAVHQDRNSTVTCHSFSLGGGLVRNDVRAVLDGEGSESTLNGLFLADGRAHVDNHTIIDHVSPHGTSHELYKGVLGGNATGIFNGRIRVQQHAQKTSAQQANHNLLLSGDAQINTNPQLEICADDVKCYHGSTIGQLDADALFYLRSRGIDLGAARTLLTYAFASEMVSRLTFEPLRARLDQLLRTRLPRAAELDEAS